MTSSRASLVDEAIAELELHRQDPHNSEEALYDVPGDRHSLQQLAATQELRSLDSGP